MGLLTVAQRLKTILDGVSSSILSVKYEYLETVPSSFPAGFIILAGAPAERMLDTVNNEVVYQFLIRTVFPVDASQGAFEKWLTLLDTIHTTFRSQTNQTLAGNAVSFMITGTSQSFSSDYSQQVLVLDIQVEAKVIQYIA